MAENRVIILSKNVDYNIEDDTELSSEHGDIFKIETPNWSEYCQCVILKNEKLFIRDTFSFSTQDPNCYVTFSLPIDCNITKNDINNGTNYQCKIIKGEVLNFFTEPLQFYEYVNWPKASKFKAAMTMIQISALKEYFNNQKIDTYMLKKCYMMEEYEDDNKELIIIIQICNDYVYFIDVTNDLQLCKSININSIQK